MSERDHCAEAFKKFKDALPAIVSTDARIHSAEVVWRASPPEVYIAIKFDVSEGLSTVSDVLYKLHHEAFAGWPFRSFYTDGREDVPIRRTTIEQRAIYELLVAEKTGDGNSENMLRRILGRR